MARNICGIIGGEALSGEEAGELAEKMKKCPYLVASGTTANMIYTLYAREQTCVWVVVV